MAGILAMGGVGIWLVSWPSEGWGLAGILAMGGVDNIMLWLVSRPTHNLLVSQQPPGFTISFHFHPAGHHSFPAGLNSYPVGSLLVLWQTHSSPVKTQSSPASSQDPPGPSLHFCNKNVVVEVHHLLKKVIKLLHLRVV